MSEKLLTPLASMIFDPLAVDSGTGTYVFRDGIGDVITVVETRSESVAVDSGEVVSSYVRTVIDRNGLVAPPEPDKYPREDPFTALTNRIFEKTGIELQFHP